MPADKNIFELFNRNKVFVETGSFIGGGINQAYVSGYRKIISIELSDHYHDYCKKLFGNFPSMMECIDLVKGDSGKILGEVISKINEPITFWLDGHYSGGKTDGIPETAGEGLEPPLMNELSFISAHPIKNHVILVDDMDESSVEEVKNKILSINENYVFELMTPRDCKKDSVLVAYVLQS